MPTSTEAETAVRNYLMLLENPESLVDQQQLDQLAQQAATSTDPLDKLRALAELERARRPSEDGYREGFIRHAKRWADSNAVPGTIFLSAGVDRSVLEAAGLLTRGSAKRQQGTAAKPSRSVNVAAVKRAMLAHHGPFALAAIAREVGGSPMTLRKAVDQLVAEGKVKRLGPAPEWSNPGRAPILFLVDESTNQR